MLWKLFYEHPAAVGETYPKHMFQAFRFGGRLMGAGVACILHGLFPAVFVRTGSRTVASLYDAMIARRSSLADQDPDDPSLQGSAREP